MPRNPDSNDSKPGEGKAYSQRSRMIHGEAVSPHWDYSHHVVPPISSSATYRLSSSQRGAQGFSQFGADELPDAAEIFIYDRLSEPTCEMLEDRLAEAEGVNVEQQLNAVVFSTGMAAISAALGVLSGRGDHIVAHQLVYGCTASLLRNWYPRYGIDVSFIDLRSEQALRSAIRPETRVVYLESPVNPTLDLIDLAMIARVIAEANVERPEAERIRSVCDNTFATPACQRPLEHGIDIVLHSLTKGIGGFGTDMGGVVIAPRELHGELLLYRKDFGGSLSPKAAWPPLVYGLPTLLVRMAQQQATARTVAQFLAAQPQVAQVRYPGLESDPDHALARRQMRGYGGEFMPGSMIYFTLKPEAGAGAAARFIDHAADHSYCITLAVSLGQIKTLIESPGCMTHSAIPLEEQAAAGLDPSGMRLSIGLEDPADLIADLAACFVILHS